jgi:GNAT superfamily N-acetyltransferase
MASGADIALVDVTGDNVEKTGFFCMMSKRKSPGYQAKLAWLRDRFAEGMRIRMLPLPLRGFIEYLPGEYAWRPLHADGYMVIHCLWVVGKSRGQGLARALLHECIRDAQAAGMKGVAIVTSEKVWLIGRKLFDSEGFECVETAAPAFSLMVKRFGAEESPSFAGNWGAKADECGPGLTIFYADQCPYITDAVSIAVDAAEEAGVPSRAVHLTQRMDIVERSPSPYGVFGMVLDRKLLAYHYMLKKDLVPLLQGSHP